MVEKIQYQISTKR